MPSLRLHPSAFILPAFLLLLAGCHSSPPSEEPLFAEQLQAVKSGASEEINIAVYPVPDVELATAAEAKSLKRLIIDKPFPISQATLKRLATLPQLEMFWFTGRGIDDAALAELSKIQALKILNLPRGEFTDAGLAKLKDLPNLIQLRFGSPTVTDAGIQTLAEYPALLRLHLIDVPITGEGLKALAKIDRLESLYIDGGHFTDADVDALFEARPKLHVHFNQQHHDRDPNKHP